MRVRAIYGAVIFAGLCAPGCAGQTAPAPEAAPAAPAPPTAPAPPATAPEVAGPAEPAPHGLRFTPDAFRAPAGWDAAAWGAWPDLEVFRSRWAKEAAAIEVVRLVRGRVTDARGTVDGAVLAMVARDDAYRIAVLFAAGPDGQATGGHDRGHGWRLVAGSLEGPVPLSFERDEERLEVEVDFVAPAVAPDPAAFADWIYVRVLVETDGPLYVDGAAPASTPRHRNIAGEIAAAEAEGRLLERIRALVDEGVGGWDDGWERAAAVAEAHGDVALAQAIYQRYRPVGRCSMDDRPAEIAREYARFCERNGKLGCFLQLHVRIMGDRFDRVAWSSYGEAAAATQASELERTGIDVDRFLRGLLISYDADKVGGAEIGLWRLARAMHEAGRGEALTPRLTAMASDPRLDEHNRLLATIALAWLGEQAGTPRAEVAARLAALPLGDPSRHWLQTFTP